MVSFPSGSEDPEPSNRIGSRARPLYGPPAAATGGRLEPVGGVGVGVGAGVGVGEGVGVGVGLGMQAGEQKTSPSGPKKQPQIVQISLGAHIPSPQPCGHAPQWRLFPQPSSPSPQ